jgi:hypothetical protein
MIENTTLDGRPGRLLTPIEAAQVLHVSLATIYRRARQEVRQCCFMTSERQHAGGTGDQVQLLCGDVQILATRQEEALRTAHRQGAWTARGGDLNAHPFRVSRA